MIDFPHAKINLGLSVKSRRPDGFHEVETVMYPVALREALEIIPAEDGEFSFEVTGPDISGDRKANLVVKAYDLMKNDHNLPPAKIHLHKAIPVGAGLGGGSADAAFAIKLLNRVFELGLSEIEMKSYARQLGSDCAFFISGQPVLASGKGDQLQIININLKDYFLLIVKPEIHINTTEAYSWIKPAEKTESLDKIIQQPVEMWNDLLINDFEQDVYQRHPMIENIKNQIYALGAVYSSLTGSGSAVFGIFRAEINIKDQFPGCFVWQGKAGFGR